MYVKIKKCLRTQKLTRCKIMKILCIPLAIQVIRT